MKYLSFGLFLILALTGGYSFAQSAPPQGISYQAIAREIDGDELVLVPISVKIGIITGSINGAVEWEETHTLVTDEFGLFSLIIGQGSTTGVGFAGAFADVDWPSESHFLRVEIDTPAPGGFELMGTSELLSVPYALYAASSGSSTEVDGDVTNELITDMYSSGDFIYLEEAGITHELDMGSLLLDNDPANETIQDMNFDAAANVLSVTENGVTYQADLSDLEDGDWHESADLTMVYNTTQSVGIGTSTPNSTLQVTGSYAAGLTELTGPVVGYQVNETHQVLMCNTTNAFVELIFPAAASCPGRVYTVKRYDTSGFAGNSVTITSANSDLIELQPTYTMSWILNESAVFVSDGNNWWVIASHQVQP